MQTNQKGVELVQIQDDQSLNQNLRVLLSEERLLMLLSQQCLQRRTASQPVSQPGSSLSESQLSILMERSRMGDAFSRRRAAQSCQDGASGGVSTSTERCQPGTQKCVNLVRLLTGLKTELILDSKNLSF